MTGTTSNNIDVSTYFTSNMPNCPVTTYTRVDANGTPLTTAWPDSHTLTGSLIHIEPTQTEFVTLYIKASSASGKSANFTVNVLKCGYETVDLATSGNQTINMIIGSSTTLNASYLFTGSTNCPITAYSFVDLTYNPATPQGVVWSASRVMTVTSVLQTVEFKVKAETA